VDEQLAARIGARLRFHRTAKRQTQAVVAGLAGITPDYLYQLERGKKLPTIPVLAQLADILQVPLTALVEDRTPERARREDDAGQAIYQALTQPLPSYGPPMVAELHDHVRTAWRTWQTSPYRYSKLARQLPVLITDVAIIEQEGSEADDAAGEDRIACVAADLYGLLRTVTKRVGRVDLALLVADRATRAAESTQDQVRLAAARWNVAHVLLADKQLSGAEDVAMHAADTVRPLMESGNRDAAALYGSLVLVGAMAAARQRQIWRARERVQLVAPLADRTGEHNAFWTAFGPTNVAMHAVAVEVEAGEASEALRLADRVEHRNSPSIERRVAFLLEQAKGYVQRREFASALLLLQTTEREAPEDLTYRPAAHQVLSTVIQHSRRSVSHEAAQLAQRISLPIE
jgi:transcriptional regulator with XRE-family HTH domain